MGLSTTPELLITFREAFPAFASVSDALVTKYIDFAVTRLETDVWDAMADEAVLLWVADSFVQIGLGDIAEVAISEAREQGLSSIKMGNATVNLSGGDVRRGSGGDVRRGSGGDVFGANRYGRRLAKLANLMFAGPRVLSGASNSGLGGLPPPGLSLLTDTDGTVFVDEAGNTIVVPA